MTALQVIISDIFDIYPSNAFTHQFVKENDLVIDVMLRHDMLHFSVVYGKIWNTVFKTFPTKKDVVEASQLLGITTNTKLILDQSFLERLLNTIQCLRLGAMVVVPINTIIDTYTSVVKSLNNQKFICEYIVSKCLYRARIHEKDIPQYDNVVIAVLHIRKQLGQDVIVCNENPITQSLSDQYNFSVEDNTYMSNLEKIQYIVYKDNHFMLKLIDNVSVVVDCDVDEYVVRTIINQARQVHDKHVLLLNCPNTWHDQRFTFNVMDAVYHILPQVCRLHVTIGCGDNPRLKSLANSKYGSIYCLRKSNIHVENIKYGYENQYCKCIVNDMSMLENANNMQRYIIHDVHKSSLSDIDHTRIETLYVQVTTSDLEKLLKPLQSKYINLRLINNDSLCDNALPHVVIDDQNKIDVAQCVAYGLVLVLSYESPYVKHMVSGVQSQTKRDIFDFVDSMCSNPEILDVLQKGVQTQQILHSNNFIDCLWSFHMKYACPVSTSDPRNGMLLYLNFLHKYFINHLDDIMSLQQNTTASNCAITVDNRANMLTVIATLFTYINLNETWTCIIYTSKRSLDFYQKLLGNCVQIKHLPLLDVSRFHIDIYNDVLMNCDLWSSLSEYDKCLVYQDDGVLLRKGIDKFLEYDYVGAPWADVPSNAYIKQNINSDLVGNGGLSLRSVKTMQQVTKLFEKEKRMLFFNNINNIPEDVYFSKHVKKINGKIPNTTKASEFSSEEILNFNSLGFHKVWSYHHPSYVKSWFNHVLGVLT